MRQHGVRILLWALVSHHQRSAPDISESMPATIRFIRQRCWLTFSPGAYLCQRNAGIATYGHNVLRTRGRVFPWLAHATGSPGRAVE